MEEQIKLGLVFLGITSVLALVGLVLMFSNPGISQLGVGDSYAYTTERGIATTIKMPPYNPYEQYPAVIGKQEPIGTGQPILKMFQDDYANIYEMSYCWSELTPYFPSPEQMFSCYVIPTVGVSEEVTGNFPPSSSAKRTYGGPIWCWLHNPLIESEFREKMRKTVIGGKWREENGVFMCNMGKEFTYPQGSRYY